MNFTGNGSVAAPSVMLEKSAPERIAFWFWFFNQIKIFLAYIFFRDDPAKATITGGLITLFFAVCVAFTLLTTKHLKYNRVQWPWAPRLLLLFVFYSGATIAWTFAPSQPIAVAYWVALLLEIVVVLCLTFFAPDISAVAVSSLKGFIVGTCAIAIVAITLIPDLSNRYGVAAELLQPNHIGNQFAMAILLCLFLVLYRRNGGIWLLTVVFLGYALLETVSKTAIVALPISLLIYLLLSPLSGKNKTAAVLILVLVMTLVPILLWGSLQDYASDNQNADMLSTFTGRTFIWMYAWEQIQERPLSGYGFMSFKRLSPEGGDYALPHAHNEWLQLWFSLGLPGPLLGLSIYIAFFRLCWRRRRLSGRAVAANAGIAILTYVIVRGFTEASVTDLLFPAPMALLFMLWLSSDSENGVAVLRSA